LKLVPPAGVAADFEGRLRAGGLGYGDLKKALFEHTWNFFAPARERRTEILKDPGYVDGVLADGAGRARSVASVVIKRARKAAGLE
jgi:tryptophanyl-tRNA synthetase